MFLLYFLLPYPRKPWPPSVSRCQTATCVCCVHETPQHFPTRWQKRDSRGAPCSSCSHTPSPVGFPTAAHDTRSPRAIPAGNTRKRDRFVAAGDPAGGGHRLLTAPPTQAPGCWEPTALPVRKARGQREPVPWRREAECRPRGEAERRRGAERD